MRLWRAAFLFTAFSSITSIPLIHANSDNLPVKFQELEKKWGLSPLKDQLRHQFEGARLSSDGQKLTLRVWYEDSSVTKNANPGAPIFCRIAHSLIFGRHRLRSKGESFPITQAFAASRELSAIEMVFFTVVFRNKPNAPNAPSQVAGQQKLRVIWAREEQVVPYLNLTITRSEWQSINALIKGQKDVGFEAFRDNLCEPVLKLTPNLKANFAALTPQVDSQRIDLTREAE